MTDATRSDVQGSGRGTRTETDSLDIPADGLSSSIMPGKTNPTPSEALTMVAAQVIDRLQPNHQRIADNLGTSLMLVTALTPRIGHDKAVAIARLALAEDLTLKAAAARRGLVGEADVDRWVVPAAMLRPRTGLDDGG